MRPLLTLGAVVAALTSPAVAAPQSQALPRVVGGSELRQLIRGAPIGGTQFVHDWMNEVFHRDGSYQQTDVPEKAMSEPIISQAIVSASKSPIEKATAVGRSSLTAPTELGSSKIARICGLSKSPLVMCEVSAFRPLRTLARVRKPTF